MPILSPRRRSILNRAAALRPDDQDENDDEAERAELVAADRSKASIQFSTPQSVRSVVSIDVTNSPQKEHYQGCLKLYAENKINKENAWNLQLIDFMSAMLRKHDSRMENLQTASTTLDASARIYSFRVDAVHYDVLKMAGGLSKAVQNKRGKRPEDEENVNPNESTTEGDSQKKKEKRKKSAKSSLSTNAENQLNGEIDINECIDPFFAQLAATTGDTTSSNRAFNATLPIDDKSLSIILKSDILFLDMEKTEDGYLDVNNLEYFDRKSNFINTVTKDDLICGQFHGFSITDWDPDEEEKSKKKTDRWLDNNLNLSQQAVAFDMNAEVEPLPEDEMGDGFAFGDDFQNVCESDEEEMGVTNHALKRDQERVVTRLVDMRPSSRSDGYLEYSYSSAIIGAWAGPAHWKLKNNMNKLARIPERRSHTLTTVVAKRVPSRKKKQLDYLVEGMAFNRLAQEYPEYTTVIPSKIKLASKTLSTWSDKKFNTSVDRGFNMLHFKKFYQKQSVMLLLESNKQETKKNELSAENINVNDYDYDNDNDTSYCPNSQPDNDLDEPWLSEECNKEGDVHNQVGVLGDNGMEMVEPPPKVAKIFIPYAMRAKKVDMKQLKHVTWKMLTNQYDSETGAEKPNVAVTGDVEEISFGALLKKLPSKLSNNMKECLSTSLSLLAVLHLANEKGLSLRNNPEFTDFSIKGIVE